MAVTPEQERRIKREVDEIFRGVKRYIDQRWDKLEADLREDRERRRRWWRFWERP